MKKQLLGLLVGSAILMGAGSAYGVLINGVEMDFVPIGDAGNAANTGAQPYGAVAYDYQIGTHEVTYTQFSAAYAQDSRVGSGNEGTWSALGADAPAANVSWHEAAKFCNFLTTGDAYSGAYIINSGTGFVSGIDRSAGMALGGGVAYVIPTQDEWYKAAYYTGSTYSLYANGTGTAPVDEADAVYGRTVGEGPWTVVSGSPEQNGTLNMMGNMWEHTETLDGDNKVQYHGGSFFQGVDELKSTEAGNPELTFTEYDVVGFRVAAIPEPGTISLMSLSTLGLFITRSVRRRRRIGASLIPVRRAPLCDSFSSEDEWRDSVIDVEEKDWLSQFAEAMKEVIASGWNSGKEACASIDKAFWNGIVASLEKIQRTREAAETSAVNSTLQKMDKGFWNGVVRILEKLQGIQNSAKNKFVGGLDAFLALIMK